jgi:2-polyprenyl-3-methyl-5-hydroxy-6-metoxy-1,4-benzoquinol methylase
VRTATLEDVGGGDETFEVVCAWHVLEHLPDPHSAASQLMGLLRPGGWLFLELPNISSRQARRRGPLWQPLDPVNHVVHYDVRTVARLLAEAGARQLDISTTSFRTYAQANPLVRGLLAAREGLQVGTLRLHHPSHHELLRVIARAPE